MTWRDFLVVPNRAPRNRRRSPQYAGTKTRGSFVTSTMHTRRPTRAAHLPSLFAALAQW